MARGDRFELPLLVLETRILPLEEPLWLACGFRISLLNMVGQKRVELLSFVYKTNILAVKLLP